MAGKTPPNKRDPPQPLQPKAEDRTRRHHTRSRLGCMTCRKRHVRCDEARPRCANCRLASRDCEYQDFNIPLRERRVKAKHGLLASSQDVWPVVVSSSSCLSTGSSSSSARSSDSAPTTSSSLQMILTGQIDPFETLAITMPLKSKQLMRYFYHSADAFDLVFKEPRDDSLLSVVHDPAALRNTLLLSGLHYAWNTGQLSEFRSTYLFHKVETIKHVNNCIQRSTTESYINCARQISTLTLIEACLGDIPAAEAHLEGLMAFIDALGSRFQSEVNEHTIEGELTDRFLLIVYTFVHGLKSRFADILTFDQSTAPGETVDPEEAHAAMQKWHEREANGLYLRLKSFRMMPRFFATPPRGVILRNIEVEPSLVCLRDLTKFTEAREGAKTTAGLADSWNAMWLDGAATRLLYILVDAHVWSMTEESRAGWLSTKAPTGLQASWIGISAAVCLYLGTVVPFLNGGELLSERLHQQVLSMLQRDLEFTMDRRVSESPRQGDLWFWQAFIGAFSLELRDKGASPLTPVLLPLKPVFRDFVRRWAASTETKLWSDARSSLQRICWPAGSLNEVIARSTWYAAINGHG